ncbi:hypothetical protein ACFYT4_35885 [Streptomyces sp. NPDC004609]|uniref:hypothetical protein n=1 Tax=Streptomyces sp. NPDC004609 TaxID=3364704 RepID=UPI003689BA01
MSTPEEQPSLDEALAHARAAAKKMTAALDEDQDQDQEPELDEPLGWQPVWKRPRKPKSKAAKKQELRKQRRRLQDAGRRRFAAGQSRPPRSRQNRIGNAGDHAGHRPPSGAQDARHPVAMHDIEWTPLRCAG